MTKCLLICLPVCLAVMFIVTTPDFGRQEQSYSLRIPAAATLLKELEFLSYGLNMAAQLRYEIESISSDIEYTNKRVSAQTHELFRLQKQHHDRLQSLGIPVFQSLAELESQCIANVSYPLGPLPETVQRSPELIALVQQHPKLCWTEFASNYAGVVYAIDDFRGDQISSERQQLLALRKRLESFRANGMIPSKEILLQSQVAKISPALYSQTMSHYDLFIQVLTCAMNAESLEEFDLTHELLQELNRRDPLNTLRTKREMLQLFNLVRSCEGRESFAL